MAILRRECELSERTLVISIALVEPDKATLHAHAPDDAVARTAAIVLVDCVAETTCEATSRSAMTACSGSAWSRAGRPRSSARSTRPASSS